MRRAKWARTASLVPALVALAVAVTGCSSKTAPSTYKAGAVPGITTSRLETLLGKPSSTLPFSLPGIEAQVLAYPFGQVVARNGTVIAVTIASEPSYVGPHGIRLNTPEDQLTAALHAARGRRSGHRDTYDLVVGDTVTRTKDLYDETDHVMYELASGNANDPETSYRVVSINLANDDGLSFFEAVTSAKVSGLYPGQRVDNFDTEPWSA